MKRAVTAAGRLIAGLLALSAAAATCQRAYRFLPREIRVSSPGFVGLLVLNFAAMFIREVLVANANPAGVLFSWAASCALVIWLRQSRWLPGMALYLAASVVVDAVTALALHAGIGTSWNSTWDTGWKIVAAAVGQQQIPRARTA